MRCSVLIPVVCMFALALGGCPKRGGGEIDVDAIQSHVDSIEKNVRAMHTALKSKNLDAAEEHYRDAVELMEDKGDQLGAYPEVADLKQELSEAGSDLCYGFVDICLQAFFDAVRAEDPEAAATRLSRAQKEFKRCRDKIASRDDFVAIKMNLESSPRVLADLHSKLERDVLAGKVKKVTDEIEPRVVALAGFLAKLEKNPNQRELAQEIDRHIKDVRAMLEAEKGFVDIPDWQKFAARINGELQAAESKRASLVRRGKVLWAVKTLLPASSKSATEALATRDPKQRMQKIQKAADGYRQCEEMVLEVLGQEPSLSRFKFKWRGGSKTVAWLKSHCKANRKIDERLLKKLGGTTKKLSKKKPSKPKPEKKSSSVVKKTKPVKKKKRHKGRIRRW
jgi:hypothetical protein